MSKRSSVWAFLERKQGAGRDVPYLYFGELLSRDQREGRNFTPAEWKDVVEFASEQYARWNARWLLSPTASPDVHALRETKGWERIYTVAADQLIEQFPEVREPLATQHNARGLGPLLKHRVTSLRGNFVQRSAIRVLGRFAIFLNRLGLPQTAGRLYTMALFPKGSVGRSGESEVASQELEKIRSEMDQINRSRLAIIEKHAAEGKTTPMESLVARMNSLKATYQGPDREGLFQGIDHFLENLRKDYGDQIPVDEVYRIQGDLEEGRDPWGREKETPDDENRSAE